MWNTRMPLNFAPRTLVLWLTLCAILIFGQESSSAAARELKAGQSIERQINAQDRHEYRISMRRGQVLFVDLIELDFNARIELIRTRDGKIVATSDMGGGFEREAVIFIAPEEATYLVRVTAGEDETDAGAYRLTARLNDSVTADDQIRSQAQERFMSAAALNRQGDPDKIREALQQWEETVALWRKAGDRYWEAHTLTRIGAAHRSLLEPRKAIPFFDQSLLIAGELGDKRLLGLRLVEMGVAIAATDRQKAKEYYNRALELFKAEESNVGMAMSWYWLGDISKQSSDQTKALEYFSESLRTAQEAHRKGWEANALYGLGDVAQSQNSNPKALELFSQALAIWKTAKNNTGQGLALARIGKIYLAGNEIEKALDCLNRAVAFFNSADN